MDISSSVTSYDLTVMKVPTANSEEETEEEEATEEESEELESDEKESEEDDDIDENLRDVR